MAEQFISVGKLGKPHGISGAFRFLLHYPLKKKSKAPMHFFIENRGVYLPWFVKEITWQGFNEGYILFEEITTPEKAKEYSRNELFLSKSEVDSLFNINSESAAYLVGYLASDESEGEIGLIQKIIENPGQVLCSVNKAGTEIMIPLVEDFILKIDKRRKKIIFNLPEGLLDL